MDANPTIHITPIGWNLSQCPHLGEACDDQEKVGPTKIKSICRLPSDTLPLLMFRLRSTHKRRNPDQDFKK